MALNKTQLKTDLLNALNAAADGKRKTLADSLADAIETYVKGATVTTTVTIPKITTQVTTAGTATAQSGTGTATNVKGTGDGRLS